MTIIRDNTFDMIKGIAILLVIIGHLAHGVGWLIPAIYTFHMPLFFIVSGYFYKEKRFTELLKRDFRTLIVPYLLVTGITILYGLLVAVWKHDPDKARYWINGFIKAGTHDSGMGPLWFLLTMFWCRLFYNQLFKLIKQLSERPTLYMTLVSYLLFVGMVLPSPESIQSINYQCIINGIFVMFYFSLGHLAKTYEKYIQIPTKYSYILPVTAIVVYACSIIPCLGNSDLGAFRQHPILNVLISVTATYLLYKVCNKGKTLNPNFLAWYGRLSLVVFCLHTVMFRIVPINQLFETAMHISNPYLVNTLTILFHVGVTMFFCQISERSKLLCCLFNLKQ